MKRLAPWILIAAAVLITVGLVVRHRDPATAYTDDHAAWKLYEEGEQMLQAFRYEPAEASLRAALEADPDLAPALAALGELAIRQGRAEEARNWLAAADSLTARLEDRRARVLLQLRLSGAKMSRYGEARDSLLALAQDLAPQEVVVLVAEAVDHERAGEVDAAERTWRRILEIDPNYAAAYNFLGYLYLNQGRYEEAETAMRRYAFVAPDLANPHDSLGDVLSTVGRYEEAEAEYRTALAKDPSFYYSLINLGEVFLARGEVDKALSLLEKVQREISGTRRAHSLAIDAAERMFFLRLYDACAAQTRQYLAGTPREDVEPSARLLQRLATGDVAGGVVLLDSLATAVRQEPWYGENAHSTTRVDANLLRYQGVAAELQGDHRTAAARFEAAMDRLADWPPHMSLYERVHLAYNLIPLGALDRARVVIREALAVNPRLAEGVLVAASIEAAAGNVDDARRLLDSLERMLASADDDFPALADARRLRAQLPDRDRI